MAFKKETIRIEKQHPERHMNIGVVIFVVFSVYLGINFFTYATSSTMAVYEVCQGTIATNHTYRGLILRDETIVYATQNGFVNYYLKSGTKAASDDVIYSVDTTGTVANKIKKAVSDKSALNSSMLKSISQEMTLFRNYYDSNDYEMVSSFYNSLNSELTQTLNMNALNSLSSMVNSAEAQNTFYKKTAGEPGVIVFYLDGYENTTPDNFTTEQMNQMQYEKTLLNKREQIKTGDPVYKRINSEAWNLLIAVSEEMAKQLSDSKTIRIRFCKDDFTMTVPFSLLKNDGIYYLNLSIQTAMIRYIEDRFVDVELVISEDYGLKIPNSAITTKEFFTIPKPYFMQGQDNSKASILVQRTDEKNNTTAELLTPVIYFENENYYYVDSEYVSAGDILVKADSTSTYTVGSHVDSLVGVYNINKGYAVFKQINIMSQNEDYAIVETKTSYGLALYDHIALNGSKVKENQLMRD